jgi:two-component system sensor histidine kinase CpxA
MMKQTPLKLSTKILLVATGNLVLLGGVFLIFLRSQLNQDFGYFLMTAGRDRARLVAQRLGVELPDVDPSEWTSVLAKYSAANKVTFMLFNNQGVQLAGPPVAIPPEAAARLRPKHDQEKNPPFWIPPFITITEGRLPYWLGVWVPINQDVTRNFPSRYVLVAASADLMTNPFFFEIRPWIGIACVALVLTLVCWLPMVVGLTRSVDQMRRATAEIAEGRFHVQAPAKRNDELGHLGRSINQMATKLDMFTRGHQRFLGDVAHELRSPIGRMQVAAAILERKAGEQSQTHIEALKEDIALMSGLTDELLTFARARLVPEAVNLRPTSLADIVSRAVRAECQDGASIEIQVASGLKVKADPEYLFRSVSNVIRNAVRYAGAQGVITVSAETKGEYVIITVADSGPGVPEDALEKIFTPFYRLEESRDRKLGGTGLGLAIVRSCVEACQGSVACRNLKPAGLEVTITLLAA